MASFSVEDFVGEGALRELVPKLVAEGWDDVPTLKLMNSDDMNALNMNQQQKVALEIRTYLHDRSLLQYGDKLEESGKSLSHLLKSTTAVLTSHYGMKRGHVARFIDRSTASGTSMCAPYVPRPRIRSSNSNVSESTRSEVSSMNSRKIEKARSPLRRNTYSEGSIEQSLAELKIKEDYVFKGIVASEPADSRLCGCVQPPPVVDKVAPYASVENISVQKLAPDYKIGMERLVTSKAPPMKASLLWRNKPAVLLCIRRPGCIMCRADAHQLYTRKPIFDALGFQLIAVLHEQTDSEVQDFWPRYWGGMVVLDRSMEFFKALGGGNLLKESFFRGFLCNPRAIANYKRAKATGLEHNYKGEGEIKGGLFIIGSGKSGIAYQFIERNFGDWAPMAEVVQTCSQLKKPQLGEAESGK